MTLIKIKSLFLILCSALAFLALTLPAQALVVLQYHHVDEGTPSSTSISPDKFLQHLQLIEDLGLEVVDLEIATRALLKGVNNPADVNLTAKQVAISFDDAYASIFMNAYPELKRRNWPFTIFVNTQAVNEKNEGIMSWQQLQTLVDDGITIANHSVTHAHLPAIPASLTLEQWLEQEILQSQLELQRRLGTVSTMLAYPYGEFTLEILPWLTNQDILAFGQQSGPIGPLSHPQALSRFPASGIYADIETLKLKLLSLALPLSPSHLQNPVIAQKNNPPKLTLSLIKADYDPKRLQCFASQQGAIDTQVYSNQDQITLTTQAPQPLSSKRARYNCTAPSSQPGRFYWYSQPWQISQPVQQEALYEQEASYEQKTN
jgi:peptidoglycan/xylan/chitin deacetylase (PgdA/CDA1 family)